MKIFIDLVNKFSKSSREVASAEITSVLHFFANSLILPNLKAVGAFVKTTFAPFAVHSSAPFHAIDFSSQAPNIIPFLPSNKLFISHKFNNRK